jgi:two-component system, cell cycle sensor histidine kinase and response regulator CckA
MSIQRSGSTARWKNWVSQLCCPGFVLQSRRLIDWNSTFATLFLSGLTPHHNPDVTRFEAILCARGGAPITIMADGGKLWSVRIAKTCVNAEEALEVGIFLDVQQVVSNHSPEAQVFQHVVEHMAEIVSISDGAGRIQYVNAAFERTMGYSKGEVLGKTRRVMDSQIQDERTISQLWETVRAGRSFKCVFKSRRKNGEFILLDETITPVFTEGQLVHLTSMAHEVTQLDQLNQRGTELMRMETLGRFAGGIAHDFNNLLTIVLGQTDILDRECGPVDRKRTQAILMATHKAAELTREMLLFGRHKHSQVRPVQVSSLVSNLARVFRCMTPTGPVLRDSIDSNTGTLQVDPAKIEQLLLNLLMNAKDALESSGTHIRLECRSVEVVPLDETHLQKVPPGSYVMFSVIDDGCGISPEVMSRLFEPYFTTKQFGKGSGLGLSLVQEVVRQCDGYMYCTSELGVGTEFHVLLPRQDAANVASLEPASCACEGKYDES